MNGTDLHTLDLQTGDVLLIQFETFKGSLYMEIIILLTSLKNEISINITVLVCENS